VRTKNNGKVSGRCRQVRSLPDSRKRRRRNPEEWVLNGLIEVGETGRRQILQVFTHQ
jgi:hypothetical protein